MAKPAAPQRQHGDRSARGQKGQKETFKKKSGSTSARHCHIQASFNNTIVTIADQAGNVLAWKSSGSLGFRGSRKGTPFAAQQQPNAASMARDQRCAQRRSARERPGSGRESAIRALAAAGIEVRNIRTLRPFRTTVAVRRNGEECSLCCWANHHDERPRLILVRDEGEAKNL